MLSSRTANSNEEYLDAFLRGVGEEKAGILLSQDRRIVTSNTRAFLHSIAEQRPINLTEATRLHSTHSGTHVDSTVLVVENIDLKWIAALGVAFNIDSSFFAEHAINPRGATPWKAIFGKWSKDHCKPSRRSLKQYNVQDRAEPTTRIVQSWHIDGVIEHDQYRRGSHRDSTLNDHNFLPRTTAYDETYGWSSSTRISYVLLHPALYLFLTDAPMVRSSNEGLCMFSTNSTLRLPLGLNRGGLVLPQNCDSRNLALSETLHRFFSHPWHFHVMFGTASNGTADLAPETIFHLIVSSAWSENLRILDRTTKSISFEDIRRPSISINDKLHDQRRDIVHMISHASMALKWIPTSVREELEAIKDSLPAAKYIGYPDAILEEIVQEAKSLEKFLMDTFNLLLSSVGVHEAELSKKKANQGQWLSQLALVYVPLSFVTGVFGMNVYEINGSPLSVWVAVTTLIVTITFTAVLIAAPKFWQAYRKSKP